MGSLENNSVNLRFLLVVTLAGGLIACSSSSVDCEVTPDDEVCVVGDSVVTSQGAIGDSGVGSQDAESQTQSELPQCSLANSDTDGDGYGFENGASCRAVSSLNSDVGVTIADINHIVVVTGQSNVEASGTVFDATLDQPHPRVFAFTDSGWQVADLHQVWDEHAHPGNHSLTDPTRSPNNNFAFHFGKSLAQMRPDAVPAFIVLAAPGKGIANWDYDSPFYVKMRSKITSALSQIPHRDKIDVLLWHQGESDALYEGTSDPDATGFSDKDSYEYKKYYEIKLRNVISNFRSEAWSGSDMPFICGELRIAEAVNRHLMALNDNDDPNSGCVTSSDLPYRLSDPSGAHFSAPGLRELGRRYMQKYLAITGR